jgi:hypothetical protein
MVPEVTARLRPRSGWESQDLGIAMVRGMVGRLTWQWCFVLIPFWLCLGLLLRNDPWMFIFITWWLKPVYDRLPLFTLSRRLFGQETKLRDVLRALPNLVIKRNWYFLTFGRLSFYRSFSMPVKVLEGGTHGTYRKRARVLLQQGGDNTAVWVTLGFLVCCAFAIAGCWMLWSSVTVDMEDSDDTPGWFKFFTHRWRVIDLSTVWTLGILHLVALTLTEIFYVGAGFGLYLNGRSHLEGWDIEVSFRSLAARLQELAGTAASLIALCTFCLLAFASPAWAIKKSQRPREVYDNSVASGSIEQTVKSVKASPDFTVHSEEYTVYDDISTPTVPNSNNWDLDGFANIFSLVGWTVMAAVVGFLIWILIKNRHWFKGKPSPSEPAEESKARVVLGMDVTPEALPGNIPEAAAECWRRGDARGALRLLYAGSLHWMIERARLPIRESDTEGDCLRHSRQLTEAQQTQYFQGLTQLWMGHAYGHRIPEAQAMEHCINQWPFRK